MAVGDVVSAIGGVNAILDFQPAAGVECMITTVMNNTNVAWPQLYNGTNQTNLVPGGNSSVQNLSCKIFVNNSVYLRLLAGGAGIRNGYTGIQIK